MRLSYVNDSMNKVKSVIVTNYFISVLRGDKQYEKSS